MRLGLLGGTFDPPHVAHLVVAEVARVQLGLAQVRFLVAGQPWMKADVRPAEHRIAMTELAIEHDEAFVLDDRETRRAGPTYTADTLEELHRQRPDAELVFLLGSDQLEGLDEWHRPDRVRELARLAVAPRPGSPVPEDGSVEPLDAPVLGISSSQLRERLRDGRAVRHQLPPAVEAYARRHQLY